MAFSEIKFHFLSLHCMQIYSINNLMYASVKALTFCRSGKKKKEKKKFRHMQSDPFTFLTCANLVLQLISRGFRELFNEMMVFNSRVIKFLKKISLPTMLACSISLLRSDAAFNSSFETYSKILRLLPCQNMMMLCIFLNCVFF